MLLTHAFDDYLDALGKTIMDVPGVTRNYHSYILIESDASSTFMKFVSDAGATDIENGRAFADFLKRMRIPFKQNKETSDWERKFLFTAFGLLKLTEAFRYLGSLYEGGGK